MLEAPAVKAKCFAWLCTTGTGVCVLSAVGRLEGAPPPCRNALDSPAVGGGLCPSAAGIRLGGILYDKLPVLLLPLSPPPMLLLLLLSPCHQAAKAAEPEEKEEEQEAPAPRGLFSFGSKKVRHTWLYLSLVVPSVRLVRGS